MDRVAEKRKPKRFIPKLRSPFQTKGLAMFFLPLCAVVATIKALIKGHLLGIGVNGLGYALYLYAALVLRKGLSAERTYEQRKIARAPRRPLKTIAAILVALATGIIAWLGARNSFAVSLVFSTGAFLGMFMTYGLDPRREKAASGRHGLSTEEIEKAIDEAEQSISRIERANSSISNPEFNTRLKRICEVARGIVAVIEDDPRDIRRARKFLNVYLEGAQKVTEGYAKTHPQAQSEKLETNFRNVLTSMEEIFSQQRDKLIENDVFDLDVQIEVLETQLKREGVI